MFQQWHLQYKLKRLINNTKSNKPTHLKTHYQYLLTQLHQPIVNLNLLALDIEMTGLNHKKDEMVSIGVIPIINGQIKPKYAQYKLLKIQGSVGQSATIHGVHDRDLTEALATSEIIEWLLQQCQDKVLVAHHALLDIQFLEQALLKLGLPIQQLFAIDTLQLEKQRLNRKNQYIKNGELRLNACRERYHLPIYSAHNALTDALACAELLLAQLNKMGGLDNIKLQDILRKY